MPKRIPEVLSVQEVERRSRLAMGNEPTEMNKALGYFDRAARDLAPPDRLVEMLDLDEFEMHEVVHFFALDILDPGLRMRTLASRAYGRLRDFSDRAHSLIARDEARAALEKNVAHWEAMKDPRLQPAIAGAKESASRLRPGARWRGDRKMDVIWRAGFDTAMDESWHRRAMDLLDYDDHGFLVINEAEAARYDDEDFIEALRQAVDLDAVTSIELNETDFHVLQLAEVYAFSFGRKVPTYFHGDLGTGADKDFLEFLEANFRLAGMNVTNREGMLRHWRKFPNVRHRLSRLTCLGQAAFSLEDAPPFRLEERREIGTMAVLDDIEAMTSG